MTIDENKVKLVIEAMSNGPLEYEIMVKGKKLITRKYSYKKFCYDQGLFSDEDNDRGEEYVIRHFTHVDKTPSCSFNESRDKWNCLACSVGGNYVSFVVDYEKNVVNRRINYYEKIEEFLIEDPDLVARSGVHSIFLGGNDKVDLENLTFFRPKLRAEKRLPSNYVELTTYLKRRNATMDEVYYSILLMQLGKSPLEIIEELYDDLPTSIKTQKKEIEAIGQFFMKEFGMEEE